MNIELSAVKAWREANTVAPAMKSVTDSIFARLSDGQDVNFLREIGGIFEDTDGCETKRDAYLQQILGIAKQQGDAAFAKVTAQIDAITSQNKLPNVDVLGIETSLSHVTKHRYSGESYQQLCDDINQRLKDLSPRRDLKR